MSFVRSSLLGSVAVLGVATGATAADLAHKKAAPAEYVRVCSEYGEGFFYIPGSEACIRISGRVRADTLYAETRDRNRDRINFAANTRLNLDVRQNTPYGTVRAYLRYNLTRTDANYGDGFNNGVTGFNNSNGLDIAYIQFAGLTAGRIQSFFDFYANNNNFGTIRSSDVNTQVLAYTASFGQGWSLTAALEDGNERRIYNNTAYPTALGVEPAGQTMPDVVGALMVEQDWGSAQLSAVLHQVRPAFGSLPASIFSRDNNSDYGFAVHGGVKLNLPMLAPGDEFWVEGAYADGAVGYLGALNYSLGQGRIASLPVTDAFIDANGSLQRTRGWSALVDYLHYWTPSVRQNVFASYMQLINGSGAYTTVSVPTLGTYNEGFVDSRELRVGTNLIWSPIKNFDIGVEALYTRIEPKGRVLIDDKGAPRSASFGDSWQGRLRIQRDF